MDARDAAKRWAAGCTVLRFATDGLVAEARDYSQARAERLLPPPGLFKR